MGSDAILSAIVSTQIRIGLGLDLRLVMNNVRRQRRYCFMDFWSAPNDIAFDTHKTRMRIYPQRALGRLLSAARELAPTQAAEFAFYGPSSGPELSGHGQ